MHKQVVVLNGYEIRDMLKTFGATYRGADKAWTMSQTAYDRAAKLAASPSAGMAYLRGFAKITAYSEV